MKHIPVKPVTNSWRVWDGGVTAYFWGVIFTFSVGSRVSYATFEKGDLFWGLVSTAVFMIIFLVLLGQLQRRITYRAYNHAEWIKKEDRRNQGWVPSEAASRDSRGTQQMSDL